MQFLTPKMHGQSIQGGGHKVKIALRCIRESKTQRRKTRTHSGSKAAFASIALVVAGGAGDFGGAWRQGRRRGGGADRLHALDCRKARLLIAYHGLFELSTTLANNAKVGIGAHSDGRSIGACI
jgi:hypothetical protein